jgi:hypothetical protein
MNQRQRLWSFAGICIVAVAIPAVYLIRASHPAPSFADPLIEILPLEQISTARPGILFRSTRSDRTFGKIAFLPLDALDGPWYVSTLTCERVYFQSGRGVCLTLADTILRPYAASIIDDRLRQGARRALTGVPSRTRLSPDGLRAAVTVFETGHAYSEGGFSTRTTLVDTTSGATIGDLEDFAAQRDGASFKAVDFNYWGVTFADGNRFYATLRTAGTNYLIEGDVDRRSARVVRAGIECPSLSPDRQRLAFKKRVDEADVRWQVAVLDLTTMHETVLDAEEQSVDDQVEWLDQNHVLYFQSGTDGNNIWSLRTDRPEPPHVLVHGGYSPAVVR